MMELDVLALGLVMVAGTLAASGGYRHASALRRQQRTARESLRKFIPHSVANALVANGGNLALERRVATVLFADIEGFVGLAERLPPATLVEMLNAYFEAVAEAVFRHGGSINQFQGDAVLATFNLPVANPEHAAGAIRAALDIQAVVGARDFAGVSLRARIGINTGEVVAGSFGGGGRLNYAVHGDSVNLAARLEQLNKELGTRILASDSTVRAAGPGFDFHAVGNVAIRGKSMPVEVFAAV